MTSTDRLLADLMQMVRARTADEPLIREVEHTEATRALRVAIDDAVARVTELRAAGADRWDIDAAQERHSAALERWFQAALADQEAFAKERRETEAVAREQAALTAREDSTVQRVVDLLRERGPLTGGEIEALRRPGLSHNAVRPILRLAVERGLVRRVQDGRRVVWVAVHHHSPE